MKPWVLILYGMLLGLLVTSVLLLISRPLSGQPITLSPPPTLTHTSPPEPTGTPEPLQVQIGGEVLHPGIYAINRERRLADLIEMAGGFTPNADVDRVNLAVLLHDGDYLFIPALNENIPETARNAPANLYQNLGPTFEYPLNLNEASQEALESIPGIGPSKARDILAYKETLGEFTALEELINVPGIGEATLDILRDYLIVEP